MAKKSRTRYSYRPSRNTKFTASGNYGVYTKDGYYSGEEGRTSDFSKMTPVTVQQVYTTKAKPKLQTPASSAVSKKVASMKPTNVKSARKAAKATVKAAKATSKAAKATSKAANKKAKTAKKVSRIANRTARKVNRIGRR